MTGAAALQQITTEPHFKLTIDALLRLEVSPLVETYGAGGTDGGADAEWRNGDLDGVNGRIVFQYKFADPLRRKSDRRNEVRKALMGPGSQGRRKARSGRGSTPEFQKPACAAADLYIVVTNVDFTRGICEKLHQAWTGTFGNTGQLCIWDASRLVAMLNTHPHLARSRSETLHRLAHEEVVRPLWDWANGAFGAIRNHGQPLYPVSIVLREGLPLQPSHVSRSSMPGRREYEFKIDELPNADSPIDQYARDVAFKESLRPEARVRDAQAALVAAIQDEVACIAELIRGLSAWRPLRPPHLHTDRALAFAVLLHSLGAGGAITPANASVAVWPNDTVDLGSAGPDDKGHPLVEGLQVVRQHLIRRGSCPAIRDTRAEFASALQAWRDALWLAAEAGLDGRP